MFEVWDGKGRMAAAGSSFTAVHARTSRFCLANQSLNLAINARPLQIIKFPHQPCDIHRACLLPRSVLFHNW